MKLLIHATASFLSPMKQRVKVEKVQVSAWIPFTVHFSFQFITASILKYTCGLQ